MVIKDLKIPDIGDFKDVPISEVCIKVGDNIKADDTIIVIESDKATMDVPSPLTGRIVEMLVMQGATVSEGSILARIEVANERGPVQDTPRIQTRPEQSSLSSERKYELVVIGAGPGGYAAAFRAADLGLEVLLVDAAPVLGGVCLNEGCIPSKALLHLASVIEQAAKSSDHGIVFGKPAIDLDRIRSFTNQTISKLTNGLAQMARVRHVEFKQGMARFSGPKQIVVSAPDGTQQTLAFDKCIIAAGSQPARPSIFPHDKRIVDSTGALELPFIPERMLVVGAGIIGLEMATIYSALGATIDLIESAPEILAGVDRDLVRIWQTGNASRFRNLLAATSVTSVATGPDGIWVGYEGARKGQETYDLVLVATGRRANGDKLDASMAGVVVSNGLVEVGPDFRTAAPHIFAIGDIVGQPMLAHKAVHQGHVAAELAAGHRASFDASVIPSVAYTSPEIAWVGMTEDEARRRDVKVGVSRFPWAASGRALANDASSGLTKLIFSQETGRIVGGGIAGLAAGDLISEVALAIELGADAVDIAKTIHPHPTLGETVGLAAEVFLGTCTDIMPQKSR
jgi:dihydrolipoamide dehydrogenase